MFSWIVLLLGWRTLFYLSVYTAPNTVHLLPIWAVKTFQRNQVLLLPINPFPGQINLVFRLIRYPPDRKKTQNFLQIMGLGDFSSCAKTVAFSMGSHNSPVLRSQVPWPTHTTSRSLMLFPFNAQNIERVEFFIFLHVFSIHLYSKFVHCWKV